MTTFTTAYFPSIGYLSRFIAAEQVEIEICDTYHKQTCRNRCFVMTANGTEVMTVPVKKINGSHTMTKDIVISTIEPWQQTHRRCLESAYRSSPYFEHYFDSLAPVFDNHYESLVELNDTALSIILRILKIDKGIVHTDNYRHKVENDMRLSFLRYTAAPMPRYYQVFCEKIPFTPGLSILDLLFNLGPESLTYLKGLDERLPQDCQ